MTNTHKSKCSKCMLCYTAMHCMDIWKCVGDNSLFWETLHLNWFLFLGFVGRQKSIFLFVCTGEKKRNVEGRELMKDWRRRRVKISKWHEVIPGDPWARNLTAPICIAAQDSLVRTAAPIRYYFMVAWAFHLPSFTRLSSFFSRYMKINKMRNHDETVI